MMEALERAAEVIERSPLVALACHVTPDGDALGSMLAMHLLCRSQGKDSVASWPEPFVVAPHYTYLPGLDAVTKPADFPESPPVMVTFDCGSLARLNLQRLCPHDDTVTVSAGAPPGSRSNSCRRPHCRAAARYVANNRSASPAQL